MRSPPAQAGVVALMASCFALACAKTTPMALTPAGTLVRVSTAIAVADCQYLGEFVGVAEAKRFAGGPWEVNQVRNLVAESGGTDVVFDPGAEGHVVGKGYTCRFGARASSHGVP